MSRSAQFVPLAAALKELALTRGVEKSGKRRPATVSDLLKMTPRQRAILADRLVQKGG